MGNIKITVPEGGRDYITEECIKRRDIQRKAMESFYKWGYNEVTTPTIEYYEIFNNGFEGLNEEIMYKFFNSEGRILVLRPDTTIPIARLVNTKLKDRILPLKVCYSANVFRLNESLSGLRNEYLDCGVELIGGTGAQYDIEVLVIALETIKRLGIENFKLDIGNINIFKAVIQKMLISNSDSIMIAGLIHNKSITALERYLSNIDVDNEIRSFLLALPWLFGGKEIFIKAKEIAFNKELLEVINYLESIFLKLSELGYEEYLSVDLSMVPRLNYYTGVIFNGYVDGVSFKFLSGGRYDKLFEKFGADLPASGFSINVDSLLDIYKYNDVVQEKTLIDKVDNIESIKEAIKYTRDGCRVDIKY